MPTWFSISVAAAQAAFLSMPWWSISGSDSWRPMVWVGLSAVMGSWKIMAISLPRMPHSSPSDSRVSSRPSNVTLPSARRPFLPSSPSMARLVTDFPQPDSPTMHRARPGATLKLTSSTAVTVPRRVSN